MPRVVAVVLAVVFGFFGAAVGVVLLGRAADDPPPPAPPPGTGPPVVVPAAGQAFVTGDVEHLVASRAQGAGLSTPFTLRAAEQGAGSVTIADAVVDGRRTTIVWNGGTPLPLTGSGGLDLGGATLEADADSFTWALIDKESRPLRPGSYRAGAAVALGESGLAHVQEGVSFDADSRTVLSISGRVVVRASPSRLELTGPGRVAVRGELRVVTDTDTTPARTAELAEGPYRVMLVPEPGGLAVDAVLQGPVTST